MLGLSGHLTSAMKRKINFAQKVCKPVDKLDEQLVEYPLYISDNSGNQGSKILLHTDSRGMIQKLFTSHYYPILATRVDTKVFFAGGDV